MLEENLEVMCRTADSGLPGLDGFYVLPFFPFPFFGTRLHMLRFPQLPQEWKFGIAFGIDVPWDETNRRHSLKLHIEDPDGERLGDEFSLDFEAGRPPGAVPGQDQRIVLSLGTQTTFAVAGPHAVVLSVGEDKWAESLLRA